MKKTIDKNIRIFCLIIAIITLLISFFVLNSAKSGNVIAYAESYADQILNNKEAMSLTVVDRDLQDYRQSPYPNNTDKNKILLKFHLNAFYEFELFTLGSNDVIKTTEQKEDETIHTLETKNPFYFKIKFYPLDSYIDTNQSLGDHYGVISQKLDFSDLANQCMLSFCINDEIVNIDEWYTENGNQVKTLGFINNLMQEDEAIMDNKDASDGLFFKEGTYSIRIHFSSRWESETGVHGNGYLDTQPNSTVVFNIIKKEQMVKNVLLPTARENTPQLFYSLVLDNSLKKEDETFLNINDNQYKIYKELEKNDIRIGLRQSNFYREIKDGKRQQLIIEEPSESKASLSFMSVGSNSYLTINSIKGFIKPKRGTQLIRNDKVYCSPADGDAYVSLFNAIDYNNFGIYRIELEYSLQYIDIDSRNFIGNSITCKDTYYFLCSDEGVYGINYELNGGHFTGDAPSQYSSLNDRIVQLISPVRDKGNDYRWYFVGWYDNARFKGNIIESINIDLKKDIKLYAKWTEMFYATLDWQDGNNKKETIDAPYNFGLETKRQKPVKKGYTFLGYYSGKNGGGVCYYDKAMNPVHVWDFYSDATLYAYWSVNSYEVTLDAQNGTDEPIMFNVNYDSSMPSGYTKPVKNGYKFLGYFDKQDDGKGTEDYSGTKYFDLDMKSSHLWDKDENTTLYAHWQNQYKISFSKQGGTGGTDSVTAIYGSSMPSADAPSKTGYSFDGYYTQSNGNGIKYYDSNMSSVRNWDIEESTILYANWIEHTYSIVFDSNGGSSVNKISNIKYSQSITLPSSTLTGHTLDYWKYENGRYSGKCSKLTSKDGITITLKAQWSVNSYTITFNYNGGYGSPESTKIKYGAKYGDLPSPNRSNSDYCGRGCCYNYYSFSHWEYNGQRIESSTTMNTASAHTLNAVWNSDRHTQAHCLASGTLITMADGSSKMVEDLVVGDMVLAINHETGFLGAHPISLIINHGNEKEWKHTCKLFFDDGTEFKVVGTHSLFNITLNCYTVINLDNVAKYLNHEFLSIESVNNEIVKKGKKLIAYELYDEYSGAYSILTAQAWNVVADGLLTIPSGEDFMGGTSSEGFGLGLLNIFTFDSNLKWDEEERAKDIDEIGLCEYSDFSDYMSEMIFELFNVKYFKIMAEKSIIEMDLFVEKLRSLGRILK